MGRYVEVTFRPLTQWPAARAHTPDDERENARFKMPGYVADSGTPSHRYARRAYRAAAAKVHPDRGGTTHDFQLVQEAKRVLEVHFGGSL